MKIQVSVKKYNNFIRNYSTFSPELIKDPFNLNAINEIPFPGTSSAL